MDTSADLRLTAFLRLFIKDDKSGKLVAWLKGGARPKAIIDGILKAPLFGGIKVGRADDDDFAPVTAKKAATLVGTGRETAPDFLDRVADPQLSISLDLREERLEVRLVATGAELARHRKSALDDMVAACHAIWRAVNDVAGLDSGRIQVEYIRRVFEYPRPRPPRATPLYPPRSLVTFLDPTFHGSGHAFASPDEPAALLSRPPPAPAKTTTDEGLTTVRWIKSMEGDLTAAATAHDLWIADRLKPDVVSGFNELGDLQDDLEGAKPQRPLTFYQAEYEMGYKTVVVFPDGSVDEAAWNDAAKVLKAKKLSNGSPVAGVRLIVPLRELVFKIKEKATEAGFEAVLYPDDDGGFWDPDPPGPWVGPPLQPNPPKESKSKEKPEKARAKRK